MNLKPGSHVHLMGICGTAMASLAGLLKDRGYKVTGSDSNPYPPMSTQIEKLGIQIMRGYSAENLNPKPDFVIVGNVISANNEEAQELAKLKIPFTSLPKALGEQIIEERRSIVVTGTHGKTTTTSLMAWVADQCGHKPGFLIGGIPKNFSLSFRNPTGDYFVIEGDEYDTAYFDKVPKFVHYKPKHVILTSIEFDHADIYKDLDHVKSAFATLIDLIPQQGHLIYWAQDPHIPAMAKKCKAQTVLSYGLGAADVQAKVLSITETGSVFSVKFKGEDLGEFKVAMTGDYNILNATSVVAMAVALGWDLNNVKAAMESFEGVKRRQEVLGEPGGVLVIEDFAHHPTAVRETIKGIKNKYKGRKVFAVFEPRSATSRRKVFQKDYVEAFLPADEIVLAKAFDQTKIDAENRFSSEELISDLKKQSKEAVCLGDVQQIVAFLKQKSHKGDLILIMSNGGFDGIYGKLMNALSS
jgi:UDP-N-acetylmuramate: L-alanyl-gamma-D-glutamyl-meso-diaminopimelate ligase